MEDDFEIICDHPLLRITALGDVAAPNVFLCFTGVNQAMGGIGAEEFVGSTRLPGYSALFISDLSRSWYNGFPPSLLTESIGPRIADKSLTSIGNSMGGYGAIWITTHFSVKTAIAFAPQFSVHPEVVPNEKRWLEFRSKIVEWRDRSLQSHFVERTRYVTINGDDDEMHWSQFPHGRNCEHLLIGGSGHGPAAMLKEHGLLTDCIADCAGGGSPLNKIRAGGLDVKVIGRAGA